MYPTRIPFEESTVYSQINIQNPDLTKFPKFQNAEPFVIDLVPGDVLYVPHNWWHYVESLNDSISINTWVEIKNEDDAARLEEIVSKTLIQSLMESNFVSFDQWINSSEDYNSQEENLEIIKNSLETCQKTYFEKSGDSTDYSNLLENHKRTFNMIESISFESFLVKYCKSYQPDKNNVVKKRKNGNEEESNNKKSTKKLLNDLANAITKPNVIHLIVKNLLESDQI